MALLEIRNLTRRFGTLEAVKGVSPAIEAGEFFTLLGPSGCGKNAEGAAGNSPSCKRRLLAPLVVLLALAAGTACAQLPPDGRWRCYQPPAYTVLALLDLGGGQLAVDGNPPQPVAAGGGGFALPAGALPPWHHAIYFAPGSAQGDAGRHTLVLAARADARRGGRAWERLPRCYLTTH